MLAASRRAASRYAHCILQARARGELPPRGEPATQRPSVRRARSKRPPLAAFSTQEIATLEPEIATPAPAPPVGPAEVATSAASAPPAGRSKAPQTPQMPEAEAGAEAKAETETEAGAGAEAKAWACALSSSEVRTRKRR